jgi:hypothetical protein
MRDSFLPICAKPASISGVISTLASSGLRLFWLRSLLPARLRRPDDIVACLDASSLLSVRMIVFLEQRATRSRSSFESKARPENLDVICRVSIAQSAGQRSAVVEPRRTQSK